MTFPIEPVMPRSGPRSGGKAGVMVVLDSSGEGRVQIDKSEFWWKDSVLPGIPEDFVFGAMGRTPGRQQTVPSSEFHGILNVVLRAP